MGDLVAPVDRKNIVSDELYTKTLELQ